MQHCYARFIFNYRSFVNSLLQLVRSYVVMVFTHVKVATVKLKKNKVPCHAVAYKLLGEQSSRELRPSQTRIQAISWRQFLLLEISCSIIIQQVCQSHDQQLYFRKSTLKRNIDCNFCSKLQKIFQVPKIISKANWQGVVNNNYTF